METSRYIWMDGELVPWEDATVHVLSHALHYGSGVFEGIRAYATDSGPAIFRHREHMQRLVNSAKAYGLPLTLTVDELMAAACQIMTVNELPEGYIRPLVFLGLGSIGLNPAGAQVHTILAAWKWGAYLGEEGVANGIRGRVSSWRRIGAESLIPSAKGTGGYLNSILAKSEAVASGYEEAIMLNAAGFVSEGSGENIFLVKDGNVTTPPVSDGCLGGITRDSVMQILRDNGHPLIEASVTRSDLYFADEILMCGTAAEVTPLREVDDRPVGDGKPGPVTQQVQQIFSEAVTGNVPQYEHWLDRL
jgi:branched-chain amino acid aminotransferase